MERTLAVIMTALLCLLPLGSLGWTQTVLEQPQLEPSHSPRLRLTLPPSPPPSEAPARSPELVETTSSPATPVSLNNLTVPSIRSAIQPISEGYLIKVGDLIQFKVLDEEEMNLSLRVGKNGAVNIPYINSATIVGKTIREASEIITKQLLTYYISPIVSMEVIEFTRKEFTIFGKVNAPGIYPIPSQQDTIGLMEAIAMAGGTLRLGDIGAVTIKRVVNEKEEIITIDGRPLARNEPGAKFDVQGGDTIIVSLSNNQFVMMGEIRSPGIYELPPLTDKIDLIEALSMAGGIGKDDLGEVTVKRKINNKEEIITVDRESLRSMSRNQEGNRFYILPGDTVAIKMMKKEFIILGQVRSPGVYPIPNLQDSVSLLEAIAVAGGATRLGNLGNVLIRREVNGKEEAKTVNAKAMSTDTDQEIFKILPGDKIIVRERMF